MSEGVNHERRRFLSLAALTAAATATFKTRSVQAQADGARGPGTNMPHGPLKQIDAGVLNVGYAEAGPADGPVGPSSARLALRHSQLCRCRARCWHRRATG